MGTRYYAAAILTQLNGERNIQVYRAEIIFSEVFTLFRFANLFNVFATFILYYASSESHHFFFKSVLSCYNRSSTVGEIRFQKLVLSN
jgi:hypothetical protein